MIHTKPFGLNIQSVIPLPGCVTTGETPDVTIRYGTVPDALPGAAMIRVCTQACPGQFLFTLDHVAKYLVEDGHCITIEPAPGVTEDEVRLFLMGTVWSALLLQRGLLPLHGSAIRVKDRAVLFSGPSGKGKSTLVASLLDRGYPVIADELCAVVAMENSPPLLLPGFPQIMLWADSLRKLSKDIKRLTQVRPGLEKYILLLRNNACQEPLPMKRLYILNTNDTHSFTLNLLGGVKKNHALIDSTYRFHHVAGHGLSVPHFKQCMDVARFIDVKLVERPVASFDLEGLVELIVGDF